MSNINKRNKKLHLLFDSVKGDCKAKISKNRCMNDYNHFRIPPLSTEVRRDLGRSSGSKLCGHAQMYYIEAREDKGDREGIPHTHPIP